MPNLNLQTAREVFNGTMERLLSTYADTAPDLPERWEEYSSFARQTAFELLQWLDDVEEAAEVRKGRRQQEGDQGDDRPFAEYRDLFDDVLEGTGHQTVSPRLSGDRSRRDANRPSPTEQPSTDRSPDLIDPNPLPTTADELPKDESRFRKTGPLPPTRLDSSGHPVLDPDVAKKLDELGLDGYARELFGGQGQGQGR